MKQSDFLLKVMPMLKVPYIWGGKNPKTGLDCSGFVQNCLDILGLDQAGHWVNAEHLRQYYSAIERNNIAISIDHDPLVLGDLIFFGSRGLGAHHVAIACGDSARSMIEAAHGTPACTTVAIANARGACVQVNPISRMNDLLCIIRIRDLKWD